MGCDIHLYVERRDGGRWLTCDRWVDTEWGRDVREHFYSGRNYDLFAILADVRNGRGFAGVKTGEGFVPISLPRGWPDDCCPELREVGGHIEHTPSWLTVAEVMAYDWTQTTTKQGVVDLPNWAQSVLRGEPDDWSGSVSGGKIKHVTPADVALAWARVGGGEPPRDLMWRDEVKLAAMHRELGAEWEPKSLMGTGNIYTTVRWKIPYYRAGENFLGCTLPRLWRFGRPEDVRVVFFFDS